jgi:hypothetical protein
LRNPSELEVISQGLFRENQHARRLLATKDKAKVSDEDGYLIPEEASKREREHHFNSQLN